MHYEIFKNCTKRTTQDGIDFHRDRPLGIQMQDDKNVLTGCKAPDLSLVGTKRPICPAGAKI